MRGGMSRDGTTNRSTHSSKGDIQRALHQSSQSRDKDVELPVATGAHHDLHHGRLQDAAKAPGPPPRLHLTTRRCCRHTAGPVAPPRRPKLATAGPGRGVPDLPPPTPPVNLPTTPATTPTRGGPPLARATALAPKRRRAAAPAASDLGRSIQHRNRPAQSTTSCLASTPQTPTGSLDPIPLTRRTHSRAAGEAGRGNPPRRDFFT
jgi:hypothetical protein